MKLPRERVLLLARKIVDFLYEKEVLLSSYSKDRLIAKIEQILLADFQMEDHLDDEVRLLMKKFDRQIESGEADPHALFLLIKKQLVKERDLIL